MLLTRLGLLGAEPVPRAAAGMGARSQEGWELGTPGLFKKREMRLTSPTRKTLLLSPLACLTSKPKFQMSKSVFGVNIFLKHK